MIDEKTLMDHEKARRGDTADWGPALPLIGFAILLLGLLGLAVVDGLHNAGIL